MLSCQLKASSFLILPKESRLTHFLINNEYNKLIELIKKDSLVSKIIIYKLISRAGPVFPNPYIVAFANSRLFTDHYFSFYFSTRENTESQKYLQEIYDMIMAFHTLKVERTIYR